MYLREFYDFRSFDVVVVEGKPRFPWSIRLLRKDWVVQRGYFHVNPIRELFDRLQKSATA